MKTQRVTPEWLALRMIGMAFNENVMNQFESEDGFSVLEPSAGIGNIADVIPRCTPVHYNHITCVELNSDMCDKLRFLHFKDVRHGDFLTMDFDKKRFNMIVAAPPFKNNVDLEHIKRMYDLLKNHGKLVSLTTPYWMVNNETHQVEFREWLRDKSHDIEMLPDNTFTEKGRTVPTAIITITK